MNTFQNNLIENLRSVFGQNFDWNQLLNLNPEDIAYNFATHYDINPSDLPSGLFSPANPEMLKGTKYSTYAPQIQAEGASLLSGLYQGLGGSKGAAAQGGFAGSGSYNQYQSSVKDVYGKSMVGVLTGTTQDIARAQKSFSDSIMEWHKAAQLVKGA